MTYRLLMYDDWQMLVDSCRSSLSQKSAYRFEPAKQEFIKEHLQEDHTFFDVGACEGFFTMLVASMLSGLGQVVAIEPDPSNINTIKINEKIGRHKNITLVKTALGDHFGPGKLYRAANVGQGSLIKGLPGRYDHYQEVSVTTLDDIAATFGQPDFIKIDVEGSELDVLAGGQEVLENRTLKYIAMDVHPKLGVDVGAVHDILIESGFDLVDIPKLPREIFAVREDD